MKTDKSKEPQAKSDLGQLPDAAFVRASALFQSGLLPFSRATLWRLVKAGKFPAPAKISNSITAWQVGAIKRWQTEMQATAEGARDQQGEVA